MKIPFSCPNCGHFTEVEPRYAGQSGQCGNCRKPITVPTLEETARRPPSTAAPQQGPADAPQRQRPKTKSNSPLPLMISGAIAILTAGWILWLIIANASDIRPTAITKRPAAKCSDNLQRIGEAMNAYYEVHGHFPAATSRSKTTNISRSWRVEILPFLGEKKLYESLDSEQAWNALPNSSFEAARPKWFAAEDDPTLANVETSYFSIVGDDMAMPKEKGRRREEFTDGLEQTILLIEAKGLAISWLDPRDIDPSQVKWAINAHTAGIGSEHAAGGVHVLMASGDVYWLDESIPPEILRALCTLAGGEQVDVKRWLKKE